MELETNPVNLIHFGFLSVKKSKFFSGGSARVYKGKLSGEEVAVKMLFCMELTGEDIIKFCAEASLLNSLRHPNIVQCVVSDCFLLPL